MKTDDLIRALAADRAQAPRPLARDVTLALVSGALVALAAFLWTLGPRPDLVEVAGSARFLLKPLAGAALAGTALIAVLALVRPGHDRRAARVLLLVPAVLLLGVAAELATVSHDAWMARLVGRYARMCVVAIPLLSAAPLAGLLTVLRRGAPTSPTGAGAVAGLVAGGIGTVLYATHCPDDSPLFVATWYTLAVAVVAAAGALCGRRLLRW